ncbi:transposase [Actinomadura chokoriensis]|uniref:Transposase IS701-like DDE domain-containing protein n=1 Tax=Actinomadura chokoriensis TaxID=454156 RepID=A0ABV4R512_9ACTN
MAVPPTVEEIDPAVWADAFGELFAQVVAPLFRQREPRLRARSFLLGLLSGLVERKNGWPLAEFAGDATLDGMQRLLNHSKWDVDAVRDALRAQVAERLGDAGGVGSRRHRVREEGPLPGGVQRQYTGTATRSPTARSGCFAPM